MRTIAVIPNKYIDFNLSEIKQVVEMIKESGADALLDIEYQGSGIDARYVKHTQLTDADMLVVLGGDGTILTAAREYSEYDVPILGINHGHLGFLAEIEKSEAESFKNVLKGEYSVAKHMMLDVKVGDKSFNALNDAVFHRGGFSRMIEFSLYIDDKLVSSNLADGLIIATPTGSTAYSLSAGGPIVDPELEILIVTPICSHDLYSRSIILPVHKGVRIVIKDAVKYDAMLTLDGQIGYEIKSGEDIIVSGGKKIGLVRTNGSSFYDKLRKKIFNGGC